MFNRVRAQSQMVMELKLKVCTCFDWTPTMWVPPCGTFLVRPFYGAYVPAGLTGFIWG
jgi:hypothetical protein